MNLAFAEIVTTAMDQVLLSSLLKPVSIIMIAFQTFFSYCSNRRDRTETRSRIQERLVS